MVFLVIFIIVTATCAVFAYCHITNPFSRITIFRQPYHSHTDKDRIYLTTAYEVHVSIHPLLTIFSFVKSGYHILYSALIPDRPIKNASTEKEIIKSIHKQRFDPNINPYVMTGGHFNILYVRNMGVFYHPMLDPYTALDEEDWENRQRVYLQTATLALNTFCVVQKPYTTIVPTAPHSLTCANIHHYPSDSLYGLFFALSSLISNERMMKIYHPGAPLPTSYRLATSETTKQLIGKQRDKIITVFESYIQTVQDGSTGLVKKNVQLSSAKDASVRQSAFYDNVILWSTYQLMHSLTGYGDIDSISRLKSTIIKTVWNHERGFFYEDLSPRCLDESITCSDWLCCLFTGFLDIDKTGERMYFEKLIRHVKNSHLDRPFPIKYQTQNYSHRDVWYVRLAAPAYGGNSIWSFWGMEYVKLLMLMYDKTKNKDYLDDGRRHMKSYERNIIRYKGFPELYNSKGDIMKETLYKSVLSTGWVVNYEQAKSMLEKNGM